MVNTSAILGKASEFFYVENVDAIIGPGCTEGCYITLNGAKYAGAMMITYDCVDFDSKESQNFASVRPYIDNHIDIANYYSALAYEFNWNILGILFSEKLWGEAALDVERLLVAQGFDVRKIVSEDYDNTTELLDAVQSSMRSKGKFIV